jgi:hypothetical protein
MAQPHYPLNTVNYSKANAKTHAMSEVPELAKYLEGGRKIYSLDLLSGWSCPFANECLSKATLDSYTNKRKVVDGPNTKFRCFSASQEAQYTNVYNSRSHNFRELNEHPKNDWHMADMLRDSMPKNLGICRIHVAGDFFNKHYFKAWMFIAQTHPDQLFYAYTKSLRYWIDNRDDVPDNLILTASYGGRDDHLIATEGLRSAIVVFSEEEAERIGAEIDHDDSHAARPSLKNQSFALLLHGTQPAGTEAATALKELKGQGSYSR